MKGCFFLIGIFLLSQTRLVFSSFLRVLSNNSEPYPKHQHKTKQQTPSCQNLGSIVTKRQSIATVAVKTYVHGNRIATTVSFKILSGFTRAIIILELLSSFLSFVCLLYANKYCTVGSRCNEIVVRQKKTLIINNGIRRTPRFD